MINTGINIETVKESKLKPHNTFNVSESIHLNNCIDTVMLLSPTSKYSIKASIVVVIIEIQAIKCEPDTPIFLPKKPEAIEANKGNIIITKYII